MATIETPRSQRIALMSFGLHRKRRDLHALTGCDFAFPGAHLFHQPDIFAGWGGRPSGLRARALGRKTGRPAWLFEDGFLKGFSPTLGEPPHSYVFDRSGVYFDVAKDNDLETLLAAPLSQEDRDWGRSFCALLRDEEITKFNDWPVEPSEDGPDAAGKPYILLIDQVVRDASIAGAGADAGAFETMLRAAADNAQGRRLLIRTHPSIKAGGGLRSVADRLGIDAHFTDRPVNPWRQIKAADAVYTVSSQMGFEALMADKPVHCFGQPFFAGRGMTHDHGAAVRAVAPCDLPTLVGAFYRHYLRFLDLHTRQPCTPERAVEQLLCVRDQRRRLPRTIHTGGLSPWKRRAVAPFLTGMGGRARQHFTRKAAQAAAARHDGIVALWGAQHGQEDGRNRVYLEDGFVRSAGLGVELALPSSLTIDARRPHYDIRDISAIEEMLQNAQFDDAERAEAAALRSALVERGITKYGPRNDRAVPAHGEGKLKILVPGQVEADASIRFGSPQVATNHMLVAETRRRFADAFIVYKPHPDVVSGYRSGGVAPDGQDFTAVEGDIAGWIDWADRVETMTSWSGFEALIRSRMVGVYGLPIYAGWGLTEDRMGAGRRTRTLDIDELVAGLLMRYPFYVDPVSRLPCRALDLALALSSAGRPQHGVVERLFLDLARRANRVAVRRRDRNAGR